MPNYPEAVHSFFHNFPRAIRVVIDTSLANQTNLFSDGVSVELYETSDSGETQGSLSVGSELPQKRKIYSDTGDDSSYNLKVSYEGWGEYVIKSAGDSTYTLFITERMIIQAGDWDEEKKFTRVFELITKIPTTVDIPGVEPPETVNITITPYEPPETDPGPATPGPDPGPGEPDCSQSPRIGGGESVILPGDWYIASSRVGVKTDQDGDIIGYYHEFTCKCGSQTKTLSKFVPNRKEGISI